jgi:hypothetical protein
MFQKEKNIFDSFESHDPTQNPIRFLKSHVLGLGV